MKLVKEQQSPSAVRQTIKRSDIQHPNLARLDELKASLSYPGWLKDYNTEAKMHRIFPLEAFEKCLFRLEEKERMFRGDRSHERLIKLDSHRWSYTGWEQDFRRAEEYHVWNRKDTKRSFERVYKEMKQKERQYRAHIRTFRVEREPERQEPEPKFDQTCTICMTSTRSHVFIPCGHLCTCESCAVQAFKKYKKCPICRKPAAMVTKVFLS